MIRRSGFQPGPDGVRRIPGLVLIAAAFALHGCESDHSPGGLSDGLDYRGMTVFFYGTHRNSFEADDFDRNLDEISAVGCNIVFLVPYHFQSDEHASVIYADDRTIPDSDLVAACRLVRSRGMLLGVKPHIDLDNGRFRSDIAPYDRERWLRAYLTYVLHYARIAEAERADVFCVGTELAGVSSDEPLWIEVIESVSAEFSGLLTYAPMPQEALGVRFWGRLDFIGVNAYFPLSKKDDPTLEDFLVSWGIWARLLGDLSREFDRPVLLTEIGYMNRKGAAADPGNFEIQGEPDERLQADLYRAALLASERIPELEGLVWWQWELGGVGGPQNADYTPRGKQAEMVLKEFWRRGER